MTPLTGFVAVPESGCLSSCVLQDAHFISLALIHTVPHDCLNRLAQGETASPQHLMIMQKQMVAYIG